MPSWSEIGTAVLEKIFKSCQYYFTLLLLFHFKKGQSPSLNRNWIPFTQGCSLQSLADIGPVVLKKLSMYFHYVVIISLCKGQGPSVDQTGIVFSKKCSMSSMVEIDTVILEKLICEKIWMDSWIDNQKNKIQAYNNKLAIHSGE